MIALLWLLGFQLLGELVVVLLDMPVPGSVVGMLLLLVALVLRGGGPDELENGAMKVLSFLPLMLVPAGVGLMQYLDVIAENGLVILAALFVSTLITMFLVGGMLKKHSTVGDKQDVG